MLNSLLLADVMEGQQALVAYVIFGRAVSELALEDIQHASTEPALLDKGDVLKVVRSYLSQP